MHTSFLFFSQRVFIDSSLGPSSLQILLFQSCQHFRWIVKALRTQSAFTALGIFRTVSWTLRKTLKSIDKSDFEEVHTSRQSELMHKSTERTVYTSQSSYILHSTYIHNQIYNMYKVRIMLITNIATEREGGGTVQTLDKTRIGNLYWQSRSQIRCWIFLWQNWNLLGL
jgi:hypothetical protein